MGLRMVVPTSSTDDPVCAIGIVDGIARASVGPAHANRIRQCYEDWACTCVLGEARRALLIGRSDSDSFTHLAARDAIASMVLAGVPPGFRLAVVAQSANLIAVYDAVIVEANRRGLEARRFRDEQEAVKWLGAA